VPSPLEPASGAAQPKAKVRKTLDTTETADLRRARHALAYFITMLFDPMAAEPMKRVLFAATALLFASCSVPTRSVVPLFDHSITRSAPASSIFGITMPRAFAALRLITSSNFVGARTGRSAGFAPRSLPDLKMSAAAVDDESSQNNQK